MLLTPAQIGYYAQSAGFSGQDLLTAVAVALAESSGDPNVYNPETAAPGGTPPGQGSYGLWQIYAKEHPEFSGWNLNDPQTNANAAFRLYSAAGGFSPWAAYNSGQYQAYLLPSLGAPASLPGGGTSLLTIPSAPPAPSGFSWGGAALVFGAIVGLGIALSEI